jgi:hypothetical protein
VKVTVTDRALRELVNEALWNKDFAGWSANHDQPAEVNSNVDPSVAATDPINPNFSPQSKVEFGVAVSQLVKNLPDSEMAKLYDIVKANIEAGAAEDKEKEMKTKAAQGGTSQVEEALRRSIRRMLQEAELPPVTKIPFGVHGKEYQDRVDKSKAWLKRSMGKAIKDYENPKEDDANPDVPAVGDGVPDAPEPSKPAGRTYKSTALGSMDDVGGSQFSDIAKEMGLSVAGAKAAVDKALEKAKFVADMDEDDAEILTLTAMNDYIKFLSKSGEISAADVRLMKDHPDIVRDLDGFREFLHTAIKRARKGGEVLDVVHDDDVVDLDMGDDEPESSVVDDDVVDLGLGDEEPAPARRRAEPETVHDDDIVDFGLGESRRPTLRLRG